MFFQFSQDQLDAVNGICDKLANSNPKSHMIAVLTGSAGTGKTTVVGEIINRMSADSPLIPIELCATTHRAANVLEDITTSLNNGGYRFNAVKDVHTGHALFKLRPTVTKTGKEIIKQTGKCDIQYGSAVIIDEASMIGNQFLTAIVDIVKDKALKLLFVEIHSNFHRQQIFVAYLMAHWLLINLQLFIDKPGITLFLIRQTSSVNMFKAFVT